MVGRLVEKKGHRYAFQALADLAARGHDVRLDVVGEGENFHRLRRTARELGFVSRIVRCRRERRRWLQGLDKCGDGSCLLEGRPFPHRCL